MAITGTIYRNISFNIKENCTSSSVCLALALPYFFLYLLTPQKSNILQTMVAQYASILYLQFSIISAVTQRVEMHVCVTLKVVSLSVMVMAADSNV